MECLCLFIHHTIWELLFHESSDCLEYPKNPYLNQATQTNTCQNFPTPKKSPKSKISSLNWNPSILPVTWNPEYPAGVWWQT